MAVLPLICCAIMCTIVKSASIANDVVVGRAVYVEEKAVQIVDTYVPLVFTVKIPTITQWPLRIAALSKNEFNQFLKILQDAVRQSQPGSYKPPRRGRDDGLVPIIGQLHKFLFGEATMADVKVLTTNEEVLMNVTKEIKLQLKQHHDQEVAGTRIINTHFSKLGNAVEEMEKAIDADDNAIRRVVNATQTLQQELTYVTADVTQGILGLLLNEALRDCEERKMNRYFVSEYQLMSTLSALQAELGNKSLQLLFPVGQPRRYFTLKDSTLCTFAPIAHVPSLFPEH